jgi:hypothetical protein
MAEIAIAAAVSAAVAGAAYTIEYALTPKAKPVEKGRLSGDVLVQDSRYGQMIPILLGASPVVAQSLCDPAGFTQLVSSDGFNRPNDSVLGTAPSTEVWEVFDGGWEILDGVAFAAGPITGDGIALLETGIADGAVEVTIRDVSVGGTLQSYGVSFRGVDDDNYWYCTYRPASNSLALYLVNGGASGPSTGFGVDITPFTPVVGDKIKVAFCGDQIDCYFNGVHKITHSSAIHNTATKHGLMTRVTGAALDNFSVKKVREIQVGEGGGMRVAGNVVYMSDVRKVETVTPAEGGKGFGNKNPDTINISYFCDLAIMFSEGEVEIAKLWADTDLLLTRTSATGATGIRDTLVEPDPDADNTRLPSPSDATIATLPDQRFSQAPVADVNGTLTGTLTNGADFRFYSGSETQLPDPLLEAHFGVGDTPAFLGRSYLVLENFEVGKYGRIPNFTAMLNNLLYRTAAECLDHLCQRVGLGPTDFDVSNVDGFLVRGIPITNREGPSNTISLIGTLFAFDVVETNGQIVCIERGAAPSFAITEDDLGCLEVEGDEDAQGTDLPELVQNDLQLDQTTMPLRTDVTFYDTARDGENNTAGHARLESQANSYQTVSVNAVLTYTEGQQLAQRLNDTAWIESAGSIRFKVPHTFADDLTAAKVGTVTRSGITHTVRIKEINGFVPGVLEAVGIITRGATYVQTQIVPGDDAGAPLPDVTPAGIPATTVATLIDRILRDRELQDGRPGFYVAACSFGNGSWGGANLYVDRGNGYVFVTRLTEQATMGVVDTTDATVGALSEVDIELYDDQTLPTGAPTYVLQGDLIYQYENATQLSTTPNLWRIDTLTNIGARCTTAENGAHAAGERFVLLNQALRFVALENDEIGVARDYKAVTVGQDINDAGVINLTVTTPNTSVSTPADWTMTGGAGSILHTWTPFSDECVMIEGLIYEIHDDAAGSPGALIYSGNSQPFNETGLSAGTYTRHFRARTRYADGSYLMATVTVTLGTGSDANFDLIAVDPVSMLVVIDPVTMNVATES